MYITKKQILSFSAACTVLFSAIGLNSENIFITANAEFEKTASQTVDDIVFGWNLGNSLDACPSTGIMNVGSLSSETSWGNPVTTKEMIDMVKESGINAVRVPVTWYNHMDPNTYQIDDAWMNRVEEVVNYVLEDDMYCIINVHHDTGENGWLKASSTNLAEKEEKFTAIWEQISDNFSEYGDKLLFEGFNEILNESSEWVNPDAEAVSITNELNQIFVDTVRKSGGNNDRRNLIVNTYCAGGNSQVTSGFTVPNDTINDRLIVEAHVYQPFYFTSEAYPDVTTWGKTELNSYLSNMYTTFVQKGVPVIIGEFGCANKGNNDEIRSWAQYYVDTCTNYGIKCFWWDNGTQYKIFNRKTLKVSEPELLNTMLAEAKGETYVPDTSVECDVNGDGKFSVADVVTVQKYLLGSGELSGWKNADLNNDGCIDIFDLCLMKRKLCSGENLCADADNWSSWVDQENGADADIEYLDNGMSVTVNNGGSNDWDVQFAYQGLTLEEGAEYKISFDYSSDKNQDMMFHVMQNYGDYKPYFSDTLSYNSEVQHYEGSFTMTDKTDKNVEISFNCGGSSVQTPFTVNIKNLSLTKLNGTSSDDNNDNNNDNNNDDNNNIIDYGTPINTNADMVADLRNGKSSYFFESGPWTNGGVFDCGWTSSNITFDDVMNITITDDPSGTYNYLSGEYRTAAKYGYGYYECSMMPIKADGVDTGFFMYTGPSDGDPWDEIDFEFLGYDTTKVQLNYYTNGTGNHEYMLDLGFDASEGYHTYGFDWQEDSITWYVDGVERYKATENLPSNPGRIMVNAWPGTGVDEWLKPFKGDVPLTAKFQWITWSENK